MGRKIQKEIVGRQTESIVVREQKWSRARIVSHSKVFTSQDLHAPEVGLSSGGRFHHPGQNVLYLADRQELAMKETIDNPNDSAFIWIQSYIQNSDISDILDHRHASENDGQINSDVMYALLSSYCISEIVPDRSSKWRPQYFVTTFIADCARMVGFKGILYSSTRSYGQTWYFLILVSLR
jgi:hypothetical protein